MDKRLFQALLITFLFLIAYSYLVSKFQPQQSQYQPRKYSSEEPFEEKIPLKEPKELKPAQEIPLAELPQATMGNYDVTYSTRGGYIKKLLIKTYGDFLPFQDIGFIPEDADKEYTSYQEPDRIVFVSSQGERKEFIFNGYILTIKLPSAARPLLFHQPQSENMWEERYQEFFYFQNNFIQRKSFKKIIDSYNENVEFAGARSRYYCLTLLKGSYNVKWVKEKKAVSLYLASSQKEIPLYLGPQAENELQPIELHGIINYGFFHGIALAMIKLLRFFHFLTKNWGISIILLSVAIYVLSFPLTYKSSQGMKEMKEFQKFHQAEIAKLREKYKDNPSKIHQATMELYKKYGFNPLKGCSSGCLPLFLQVPLIWAFWSVTPRALELKGAKFLWIKDLSLADQTIRLPFDLPFLGQWINVLPILTSIVMYVQMKFTNPGMDPEQAQQQKMMTLIFPIMIGAVTYHFPAALLLYWFINSLLTFISQWKLMKVK